MKNDKGYIYLLHFDTPYKHAKHYTGFSKTPEIRISLHKNGASGVPLLRTLKDEKITFTVAMIRKGTYADEQKLKRSGSACRYCPICLHGEPDIDTSYLDEMKDV